MNLWPFGRKPDAFDAVLKQYVDDDLSMFACGKDAPSEADLRAFESSIGFPLPADFRHFSKTPIGGIFIQAKESVWPRGTELQVGPFWSFLYGMFVFGFGNGIPEWMDIRAATPNFRGDSGTNYVPCLKVMGNPDVYCFDPEGRVRQWDHETGEAEIQEGSFLDLFTREVIELRKRKDRMKAGEGAKETLPQRSPPPIPPPLPPPLP